MSSRWAKNEDDQAFEAQRKQDKEEKRRIKAENKRKAEEQAERRAQAASENVESASVKKPKLDESTALNVKELELPAPALASSRSLKSFEVLNKIEEGSYGLVCRAKARDSGNIVALKRLKMDMTSEGFPITGLREIQTLKACTHPHIVQLHEVVVDGDPVRDVYLVMEFVEHDMKDLLGDMDDPFSPSEVKTLMLQLCSAVEYLHSHWIIHRDLKTSNLLLNNRGQIKVADFGMARYTGSPPPRLTQLVVTLWYRAPELLLGAEAYGFEIDVWSLGCIFFELLTKEPAFSGKNEVSQLSAIFDLLGAPTNKSWPSFKRLPNAKALHPLLNQSQSRSRSKLRSGKLPSMTRAGLDLLHDMLSLNPENRPTASEILSDGYFSEDPRPKPREMLPTFPSRAGQERRRRKDTPPPPDRGHAPSVRADDFAAILQP